MNNNEPLESKLKRLSETVSLRASEKNVHRENLKAFMQKSRMPVRSPYMWFVGHGARTVGAFALFLIISGGGVVSAEISQPGDPLYLMKLKVTEPVRSALILDPEEKTAFTLERTDRRLKEFAAYSTTENPDAETVSLITTSLSESIDSLSEDVAEYAMEGDADLALNANSDLQSILSAHSRILNTLAQNNPETLEDITLVSRSVDTAIADTENAEDSIENALESILTSNDSDEQARETEEELIDIRSQVTQAVSTLDEMDRQAIEENLSEVQTVITEAREAHREGDLESSFLLYAEAGQQLIELETFIEADRNLGIGILDSDE